LIAKTRGLLELFQLDGATKLLAKFKHGRCSCSGAGGPYWRPV
jgi:hypothetical protein